MKKFLVLAVVLSITAVACDAFKDSYDGHRGGTTTATAPNVAVPETPATGEAVDYSSDTTECAAVNGVTVTKSEQSGAVTATELSVAAEGTAVTSTAERLGQFTTKITVTAGEEVLSFTLKQTAETAFSVCEVTYGTKQVTTGSITVDKFNDGADLTSSVNAGAFNFEFQDAPAAEEAPATATSVIRDLLTPPPTGDAATTTVEGSYFVQGLTVTETVSEEGQAQAN